MIDNIITSIYQGIVHILKGVLFLVGLALFSYVLSYFSEANTREIFIRLIFVLVGLKVLYNLGSTNENYKK